MEDWYQKLNTGLSKVPIIGGMSRLYRYPAEIGRVLAQSGMLGAGNLLGMDTANLSNQMGKPLYMSDKEWGRTFGAKDNLTPLLESASAGTEILNFAPFGAIDDIARGYLGFKQGAGFAKNVLPWLGGKVAMGAPLGLIEGLQTMPSDRPKDIPKHLKSSTLLGTGFTVGLGALGEGLKGLKKLGQRTSARGKGLIQKGDTTQDMANRLKAAKGEEGLALTAQGQLDKAANKIDEWAQKKISALDDISPKKVASMKKNILSDFESLIDKSLKSGQIRNSPIYQDILKRLETATTPQELDDIAILARNGMKSASGNYPDVASTVAKDTYNKVADSIVGVLKNNSGKYKVAKETLSDILSRVQAKEFLNKTFLENKGIGAPLVVSGSETPIPRAIWSTIQSVTGGAEQLLGKIAGSPMVQRLGASAATETVDKIKGNALSAQPLGQPQPSAMPSNLAAGQTEGGIPQGQGLAQQPMVSSMAQSANPALADLQRNFGSPEQFMGGGMQEQQEGGQFDMQKLQMDLLQAVMSGQISPTQADYLMQSMQSAMGGQSITDQISELAQTDPQQAQQLLGQGVLSGQIDPTTAKTYASLLGLGGADASSGDFINAQSGLNAINQIESIIKSEGKVPFTQGMPFASFGNTEAEDYSGARNEAKDILTRTRTGAALNMSEEEFYDRYIPGIWDSEGSTQTKINRLKGLYSALVIEAKGGSDREIMEALSIQTSSSDLFQEEQSVPNQYSDWER